jgi:hypothetical protein
MRIRILVRLCRHKKFNFDLKNTLYGGDRSQDIPGMEFRFIRSSWSNSLLFDQDPNLHSQYGTGPRRVKSMRIRIHDIDKNSDTYYENAALDLLSTLVCFLFIFNCSKS